MTEAISTDKIKGKIYQIRGRNVMLDKDLAELYGVTTKRLNEQVKRNIKRFPADFMFLLTNKEVMNLRSQIATSSWGGRRYVLRAFTEQGVAMLSSALNSNRAIKVNIQIMRAFVSLRRMVITYESLKRKIDEMEKKYDGQFQIVFKAIKKLMEPPVKEKPKRKIGFRHDQ
ncbi:MAG: ORF6N domain-containing protein [Candidatus Omnitrophota bacterium]